MYLNVDGSGCAVSQEQHQHEEIVRRHNDPKSTQPKNKSHACIALDGKSLLKAVEFWATEKGHLAMHDLCQQSALEYMAKPHLGLASISVQS